jgi:hypothetical protein
MAGLRKIQRFKVKKAQGFEAWFFVIVILLAIALFFLVLNKAWDSIKTPLGEGLNNAVPANSESSFNITKAIDQTTGAGFMFDKLIPFIIIGLFAFVLIIAGSIVRHPIMIFVGIIILGVIILIAVIYSNLYHSISSTDEFASTTSNMVIQDKFMQYLPYVVFIMAVAIVGGILWSRSSGGSSTL